MCSLPAHNPCVPFSAYITNGLNVGTRLIIRGLMPYNGHKFAIDLQCGGYWMQDDIAFHLSIRPSEYAIVRNSFQCRNWGAEERYGSCPIQRGQPFDIEIQSEYNRFIVRINGAHFCEFNHRIPIQRISHINISGDTALYYVGNEGYPHGAYPPPPPPCPPYVVQQPVVVASSRPSNSSRPLIGAAVVGGLLGAALARPGHHHHHHHHRRHW